MLMAVPIIPLSQDTSLRDRHDRFKPYQSLMSLYPLLRMHLPHSIEARFPVLSSASPVDHPGSFASSGVLPALDVKPLKAAAIRKWWSDSSRKLCQYEVPGGGECRDHECQDVHPSRVWAVEPSGTCCSSLLVVLTSSCCPISSYPSPPPTTPQTKTQPDTYATLCRRCRR